ncbi:Ppx/GppA family phosphatase [Idiomarina seosinensis]|uniref:Ppx/GppA phosphatase family protein n=1 Tax=Idiomarina seosinensis TaxID=281739 RepID=UPI00384F25DD
MRPGTKRLAAVDMGSNSFHLLLAEVSMRGFFPKPRIVSRHKYKVRLADGLDSALRLDKAAVRRAKRSLDNFAEQLKLFQPDACYAVATAALRKASNCAEVLPELEQSLGCAIEVISGEREAELIFAGVCNAAQQQGDILVIDIGGASTELIAGRPLRPRLLKSLDMGCVIFQNQYFADGKITTSAFTRAIGQARNQLNPYTQDYQAIGWQHVLGASGTFRAVTEIALAQGQVTLSRDWLEQLIDLCVQQGQVQQLRIPGLRDDRKTILCGGLAILYAILIEFDIHRFGVTNGALREGLLSELVAQATA